MKHPRVLIVEDDRDTQRLLATHMRAQGYRVFLASDAPSAGTVARKAHPDVVVLDLGLPGGDGLLVLQRLRAIQTLADIPVVIYTGRTLNEADEQWAGELGVDALIEKDRGAEELLNAVRSALGEPVDGFDPTELPAREAALATIAAKPQRVEAEPRRDQRTQVLRPIASVGVGTDPLFQFH